MPTNFNLWTAVTGAFSGMTGLATKVIEFVASDPILVVTCIAIPLASLGIMMLKRLLRVKI